MKLVERNMIYRDGNSCQAIRYTEMGTDDRSCDIQLWELMTSDLICSDGNGWQVIGYTEMRTDGRLYDIKR